MKKTGLIILLSLLATFLPLDNQVFSQGSKGEVVETAIDVLKRGGRSADDLGGLRRIPDSSTSPAKFSGNNSSGFSGSSGSSNFSSGSLPNSSVKYNNGYRTPDGKFASPTGNASAPGIEAEKAVWNSIESKNGWSVTRGRVYVKDANNQVRVYDGVAHSPRGKNIGLEVKSGSATKTSSQRSFDNNLNNTKKNTATGIGQNKGMTIHRTREIKQ